MGEKIYSAFHDWRAALMDAIAARTLHTDYLRVLRSDMARTLEMLDRELERRARSADAAQKGIRA